MDDFQGTPQTSLRGGSGCGAFSFRKNGADGSVRPWMPVFWTCSGIVKSPASMTSVRSPPPTCFCLNQICSAIAEPKVPPPTTIDHVERPASSRCPGIDLRDVIAEVAAFHVLRERRSFCKLRHVPLLLVRSTMVGRASLTISRFYLGRLRLPNSANYRPFYLRVCASAHIHCDHFLRVIVYRNSGPASGGRGEAHSVPLSSGGLMCRKQ